MEKISDNDFFVIAARNATLIITILVYKEKPEYDLISRFTKKPKNFAFCGNLSGALSVMQVLALTAELFGVSNFDRSKK